MFLFSKFSFADFTFSYPKMFEQLEEDLELHKTMKQQEELKDKLNEGFANRNRRVGKFLSA